MTMSEAINRNHTDHGLEATIELDWKIMIRAPHHPWRNYISHTDHGLEAAIELGWEIRAPPSGVHPELFGA